MEITDLISSDGDLLRSWFAAAKLDISYERHSCSGDTTDGLNKQIEQWKNNGTATLATVTIGGNDVGFSDLVYYCLLTPNTARFGSTNRRDCLAAEKKANDIMDDIGPNGLRAKLRYVHLSHTAKEDNAD